MRTKALNKIIHHASNWKKISSIKIKTKKRRLGACTAYIVAELG